MLEVKKEKKKENSSFLKLNLTRLQLLLVLTQNDILRSTNFRTISILIKMRKMGLSERNKVEFLIFHFIYPIINAGNPPLEISHHPQCWPPNTNPLTKWATFEIYGENRFIVWLKFYKMPRGLFWIPLYIINNMEHSIMLFLFYFLFSFIQASDSPI